MEADAYLTIKSTSEGIFKEKGSRFISYAYPVSSREEIKTILESIGKQHHSARHICFAWVLGPNRENWRINDDGEPSGTAGKPILGQINSLDLTDILVVVVRYFGGKLLGVPGLINAYRSAAHSALNNAEKIKVYETEKYVLAFPYTSINEAMKIMKDEKIAFSQSDFGLSCTIQFNIRPAYREKILSLLSRIPGASVHPL